MLIYWDHSLASTHLLPGPCVWWPEYSTLAEWPAPIGFSSRASSSQPCCSHHVWDCTDSCLYVDTSASKSSIRRFVITEKAPTRAFSWLKAATTAFTFKTLLRHYSRPELSRENSRNRDWAFSPVPPAECLESLQQHKIDMCSSAAIHKRLTRYIWWSSAPVFSQNDDYDISRWQLLKTWQPS